MKSKSLVLIGLFLFLAAGWALAVDTPVTVYVQAKDAKFVGTSMGGALVTIRDADTGELLAKGVTAGSTGDTEKIMKATHSHGAVITDAKTGHFTAVLDISEPRYVEITAYGPLAQRQSAGRVSVTQWILPGKPITQGNAITLELPGFVVDVTDPPNHIRLKGMPQEACLAVNVTMMCGCPIEPGGLWDANRFQVQAILKYNGKPYGTLDLKYAGETSQFAGSFRMDKPGVYEAVVTAYDPATGNTGLDSVSVIVTK